METILIIEDNEELCDNVSNLLGSEGFSLVTAGSGEEGLSLFDSHIDLIVLDVMLPGISGIDVCREIRRKSFVPILFLTAKTEDTDKALGLLSGGDDYLVKPFSFIELVARIRALLRRSRQYSRDNTEENGVAYQAKEQWLKGSRARSSTQPTMPAPLSEEKKTCTRWQRQTELLHIIAGNLF